MYDQETRDMALARLLSLPAMKALIQYPETREYLNRHCANGVFKRSPKARAWNGIRAMPAAAPVRNGLTSTTTRLR